MLAPAYHHKHPVNAGADLVQLRRYLANVSVQPIRLSKTLTSGIDLTSGKLLSPVMLTMLAPPVPIYCEPAYSGQNLIRISNCICTLKADTDYQ